MGFEVEQIRQLADGISCRTRNRLTTSSGSSRFSTIASSASRRAAMSD
jgi:hypothetical protein